MLAALRDSVRAWRRSPGVAVVATLSLALGIGATTTCFAIVDRLLLRTLDVPDPDRLVHLTTEEQPLFSRVTLPVWEQIQQRSHLYDSAFAWTGGRAVNLAPHGEADFVTPVWASGRAFETLRIGPQIGRLFDERDDAPDGGADGLVAVISHAFWKRRFGAASDVVGRIVTVERVPVTIIGVLPASLPGFTVATGFDLALPLRTEPRLSPTFSEALNTRFSRFRVVMRLAPGRPAEAVESALRADQPAIRAATLPTAFRRAEDREAFLRSPFVVSSAADGGSGARSYYGEPAAIALGLAVLVLLACCANVATALLAHGARRQHELSVRAALGASRWEAARQLLADSLLLSLLGAAAGLVLSQWARRVAGGAVERRRPEHLAGSRDQLARVGRGVLDGSGHRCGLRTRGSVACGPRRAGRHPEDPRSAPLLTGTGAARRGRGAAGVLGRGDRDEHAADAQLRRHRVLVGAATSRGCGCRRTAPGWLERSLPTRAKTPPSVSAAPSRACQEWPRRWRCRCRCSAAATSRGSTTPSLRGLTDEDRMVLLDSVGPSHFDTLGIRMLSGRNFDARDVVGSPPVGIVNQAFARRYFGGELRVPHRIGFEAGRGVEEIDVIGVVEDVPDLSITEPVTPLLYRARTQEVLVE